MKICLITGYPPSRGRLSEYAKEVVNALVQQREVERIYLIANASQRRDQKIGGKLVVKRLWKVDNLLSPLRVFFTILRLRPDVVHFNVHLASFGRGRVVNFAWSLLMPLLALFKVKTVVSLHNLHERINIEETGLKNSVLNRFGLTLATKFYTFASSVIVTMRSYVGIIGDRYRKQAFHIPHGANLLNDPPPNNPGHHLSNNPNPGSGRSGQNLLFMGYVGPYKDVGLLLDAFRRVRAKKPWVKLLFAGSAHPNYPEIIKRVEDFKSEPNVVFLGYTPKEKLPKVLEDTRVIALPYTTCTGTSGVVHLLACFEKPMVVTDLPEFRELRNEGAGIMLVNRDPGAFSEAITKLMEDEELYTTLGEMNQAFAQGRTWDKVVQAYVKLYKAAVSRADDLDAWE